MTLFLVLTVGIAISQESDAETIVVDEDWVVDTNEGAATDNTYVMKANLTVTSSGQISFRRCKFEFRSPTPGFYGVTVHPGGYLSIHTCSLKAGLIGPSQLAEAWTFFVQDSGRLQLQSSTILDLGVIGGADNQRGLAIQSDSVMISNNTFEECHTGIVVLASAAPNIQHNTFKDSNVGMEVKGSTFHQDHYNTFQENAIGILFVECGNGYLGAGQFSSNGFAVRTVRSTVRLEAVTVDGMGNGFSAEADSFMVVDNSTIWVLFERARALMDSTIHMINCNASGWAGFTATEGNSHVIVYDSVRFKVAYAGAEYPVKDADVELLDNLGNKAYQQVTNDVGYSPWRNIVVFEHHQNKPAASHQPFKAVASAGFNYEEKKDILLEPNHLIEIHFVDDEAPDLTVQLPVDDAFFNTTEVEMKGRLKDLNSGISSFFYMVNGGSDISLPIQDPWQVVEDLPEGVLTITFVAIDFLGNERVEERTITVDTTPPVILSIDPPAGSTIRKFQLWVNGTTEAGSVLSVQGNDWEVASNGTFKGLVTMGDAEGQEIISFTLTDPAGNVGVYQYALMIDRTPPVLDVETDPDHRDFPFINQSDVLVFGNTEPGATVRIQINGLPVNETLANELGKWNIIVQLVLGENDLLVDAYDPAGNRASVEIIDFLYDTTAPEITLLIPDDGDVFRNKEDTILVKVRSEPGATVWVNDEMEQMQPDHGEIEFKEVDLKFEGNNTITIYARDKAGNLMTMSIVVYRDPKKEPNGGESDDFPIWLIVMALAIVGVVAFLARSFLPRGRKGQPPA
jgi:parallel beta-helix repeat protein